MAERAHLGHNASMAGNNLAELRKRSGLSQTELAERIGTTLSMLGKLERGDRNLTTVWMDKLATALKVPRSALIADELPADTRSIQVIEASETAVQLKLVDLGLSMGDGANIDDLYEEGTIGFDLALLRSITRSPPDRLFVARGEGDSMFPTLINEDMVVIDTMQTRLTQQDRIWACAVYGAGAIKRLRAVGKNRVEVISDNPTVENREVDADDLRLIGRVVWIGRKV